MKNFRPSFVIKTALVLTAIAATSALLIGGADLLTKDIIETNAKEKEKQVLQRYFGIVVGNEDGYVIENDPVLKKYFTVKLSNEELCYVYRAEGKNGFGNLSLLAGIKESGVFYNLHVLENGQSYGAVLQEKYLDPIEQGDNKDEALNQVKCGATKGATLALKLVNAAKDHFNKYIKEGQHE